MCPVGVTSIVSNHVHDNEFSIRKRKRERRRSRAMPRTAGLATMVSLRTDMELETRSEKNSTTSRRHFRFLAAREMKSAGPAACPIAHGSIHHLVGLIAGSKLFLSKNPGSKFPCESKTEPWMFRPILQVPHPLVMDALGMFVFRPCPCPYEADRS